MKVIAELMKDQYDRSLLLVEKGSHREYVICTDYDPAKPEGSQWIWGHYFYDLVSAVNAFAETPYYYEVVEVIDGDEMVVDSGFQFEAEVDTAKNYKNLYPDRTYKVMEYRECGSVFEV